MNTRMVIHWTWKKRETKKAEFLVTSSRGMESRKSEGMGKSKARSSPMPNQKGNGDKTGGDDEVDVEVEVEFRDCIYAYMNSRQSECCRAVK